MYLRLVCVALISMRIKLFPSRKLIYYWISFVGVMPEKSYVTASQTCSPCVNKTHLYLYTKLRQAIPYGLCKILSCENLIARHGIINIDAAYCEISGRGYIIFTCSSNVFKNVSEQNPLCVWTNRTQHFSGHGKI